MIFKFPGCGGCMTCEMACSFVKTGSFNRLHSALEILSIEGDACRYVRFTDPEDQAGLRAICDGCPDTDNPMCVSYCRKHEELKELLREYRKTLNT